MKQELSHEIENNIMLYEDILREVYDSWEDWKREEYERELIYLEEEENQENQIFCPVCQINLLKLQENIISCNCGLR